MGVWGGGFRVGKRRVSKWLSISVYAIFLSTFLVSRADLPILGLVFISFSYTLSC